VKHVPANRVLEAIGKHSVLNAGDRVSVAVSGGADSVALLLLLLELRAKLGLVLSVAHFNHMLRGRASDADEKFVAKLAAKYGLTFYLERGDVREQARRDKRNLEDAARRARHAFFAKLVQQGRASRIAVAHTADDQAETVLAHILRGTGLRGLGGIHPSTDRIIRPVLDLRRAELRAYLKSQKQTWREDATNRDTSRTRARIREKLMPLLEKHFQSGVVERLASLAGLAREDEALLDAVVEERFLALVKKDKGLARIKISDLLQPAGAESSAGDAQSSGKAENRTILCALSKRLVRRIIKEVKTGEGQITAPHVQAVLELAAHGENGKLLQLPASVEVRRERDTLIFLERASGGRLAKKASKTHGYEYHIDIHSHSALVEVQEMGCAFRFTVIDWPSKRGETSNIGAVVDRDRLRFPLVLRNWRPGDKLQPAGHRSAHKLKRLLNEKRISRWEREGWPVLLSCGTVFWARGFPVASEFAAGERTRAGIVIAEENL
jgi:tRNA(Ile)-lysidine synthase